MIVCMFVKNSFEYDARVTKEATALIAAGHDVSVVALAVPGQLEARETRSDGIDVVRVKSPRWGTHTFSRVVGGIGASVEDRHSRLTGTPVDEARRVRQSSIAPPSTATPTAPRTYPDLPNAGESTAIHPRWAAVTTPILRSLPALGRSLYRLGQRVLGRPARALSGRIVNRRMVKVGTEMAADVYHAHDLNTLGIAARCRDMTSGSRLIYDSHELQTERNRMTPEERRRALSVEGSLLPSVDAMIVASPSWIEWNRKLYGSIPDPSVAILNVPVPTRQTRSNLFREELGIHESDAVVLYQGSIQENRGLEPAIEAVRGLPGAVLVIVGYGHLLPILEEYVARENLNDKVRFFGPIPNDDLIRYAASADVGLCNIVNSSVSYHTSLPNKLFEYAMADIPVVGSDSPEIGRVIREQRIGEVCDPVDPDALRTAIGTVLANRQAYAPGLAATRERYNWTRESAKLITLYDGLMVNPRRPSS